jgi:toxin ParE1/3/4
MIVRLTDEAERDIETIGDFTACDNPQRAISFTAELRDQCLGQAHLPEGFPLVPRYESKGVRRCLHGSYLIFYYATEKEVVVLHVLHGAQDYAEILG